MKAKMLIKTNDYMYVVCSINYGQEHGVDMFICGHLQWNPQIMDTIKKHKLFFIYIYRGVCFSKVKVTLKCH